MVANSGSTGIGRRLPCCGAILWLWFSAPVRGEATDPPQAPPAWLIQGFVAGLDDPTPGVFMALAKAQSEWGVWRALRARAAEIGPTVAGHLNDERNPEARRTAIEALVALDATQPSLWVPPLAAIEEHPDARPELRAYAHLLGGLDPASAPARRWLGRPEPEPAIDGKTPRAEVLTLLTAFQHTWPWTEPYPGLRSKLADSIGKVVDRACPGAGAPQPSGDDPGARLASLWRGGLEWLAGSVGASCWGLEDRALLLSLRDSIRAVSPHQADTLDRVVAQLGRQDWAIKGSTVAAGHLAFWLLLLAYPHARPVRTFFFWNPWVRRLLGVFYVNLLLLYVPPLRRRLLLPFRRSLLADAQLDRLEQHPYFPHRRVRGEDDSVVAAHAAIPAVRGQIVLEGESGLGKSLFLRKLAEGSRRLTVFLEARRCERGVIEAIQDKLAGNIGRDVDFLRQLVSAGALDVIIDGINEVAAETRGRITDFVEKHFEGNVILATQPLEWKKPATAKTYQLLPLADEQIEEFLLSREAELDTGQPVRGEAYREAARAFLAAVFAAPPADGDAVLRRTLSNPMDLFFVAQVIAQGRTPDLMGLQEQAYALMAADYTQTNHGTAFPLQRFAEHVYALRLQDAKTPSAETFPNELAAMERHRLLVRRGDHDEFRHDRVMDFFLCTALDPRHQAQRALEHIGDARFRSTYLLMVQRLPPEQARLLRDAVVEQAADSGDHSLSDEFVRLLRVRLQGTGS